MILRIRLQDGRTVRATASASDFLSAVISATGEVELTSEMKAFREATGRGEPMVMTKSVSDLGLMNGDIVFLKGGAVEKKESSSANGDARSVPPEKKKSKVCKVCGPGMMCTKCVGEETKEERLQRALGDLWTEGGMSSGVEQALEAFRFKLKRQEEGRTKTVLVDNEAAFEFQAYLARISFQQQRCGFLYGSIKENEVIVSTIYEPPQEGTDKIFKVQNNAGAKRLNERAEHVAKELGLVPVGMIFSHKMREAVLSGYEIATIAAIQNEVADKYGEELAKSFVILTVAPNDDGTIQFNSYQLSDQCLEMSRKGVFAPSESQRRNAPKVKTNPDGWLLYQDKKRSFRHFKVLVENAETDSIPIEFFLINVAIQSHKSWLRTLFTVENREIAPQLMEDAGRNLKDKSDPRFFRRISDFHFLNFLAGAVDLESELPGLLEIVREQREPTADESGYQVILEALTS